MAFRDGSSSGVNWGRLLSLTMGTASGSRPAGHTIAPAEPLPRGDTFLQGRHGHGRETWEGEWESTGKRGGGEEGLAQDCD